MIFFHLPPFVGCLYCLLPACLLLSSILFLRAVLCCAVMRCSSSSANGRAQDETAPGARVAGGGRGDLQEKHYPQGGGQGENKKKVCIRVCLRAGAPVCLYLCCVCACACARACACIFASVPVRWSVCVLYFFA